MVNDNKIDIFIAYARLDFAYLVELKKYLRPLERKKFINFWYDGEIIPGSVWEKEIKEHLENADMFIMLVSANSIASDYFYDKELENALKRHNKDEAILVPIILRSCAWKLTPLSELQALPENGKPIHKWENDSDAYTNVVLELYRTIRTINDKKKGGKNQSRVEALERAQQEQKERIIAQKRAEQEKKEKAEGNDSGELNEKAKTEKNRSEKDQKNKAETQKIDEKEKRLKIIKSFDNKYNLYWERYDSGLYKLFDELGNKIGNNDTEDSWLGDDYLVFKKDSKTTYLLKNFRFKRDGILRQGKLYTNNRLENLIVIIGSVVVFLAVLYVLFFLITSQ